MKTVNVRVTLSIEHPMTQMPWQTVEVVVPVRCDSRSTESDILGAAEAEAYRRYPSNSRVISVQGV